MKHRRASNQYSDGGLTPKEAGYIKSIAQGSTRRDAIRANYNVKPDISPHTLDNMASAIEKRPQVARVLARYSEQAEQAVIEVLEYSKRYGATGTKEGAQYARVALDGANSIIDRVHGKATQRIEQQSAVVTVAIDLSASE